MNDVARPTSVTVFGILHIVFAVLGLCGLASALMTYLMPSPTPNPVLEIMDESPAFAIWNYSSLLVGLVMTLLLLGAGIFLLLGQKLGRTLSNVYAVAAILFVLLGLLMNTIFLFGPLLQMLDTASSPEEVGGAIGGLVGGLLGSLFGLVYPIVVLVFMRRRPLVEYLESR